MRIVPLCLGCACSIASAAAAAVASDAPAVHLEIQREELSSTNAFEFVQSLCDEAGPRLAGSAGDRAAVAWALRTMRAVGLQNVHAEPVKVARWERGEESARIVSPVQQPLAVAALGGSVGTPARGLEAEVVEVASLAELGKLPPGAAAGKIVFLNAPMRRSSDGRGYGETVSGRHRGAREAQKHGAVALVLRSVGTDRDRFAHTGSKSKDDREIPAAAISVPDAEMLHRVLADKKSARVRLVLGARSLPPVESANVVGEVTGREKPDQIVLLGAHLDSWDLGAGAVDDGAGVGIALETARLLLAHRPRRTLRVVLFANEEHGLEGAREYARVHSPEAGKHVVAMEADFGADAVYAVRYKGDPAARDRFAAFARTLAPIGVERQDAKAGGGADLQPLVTLGVPVVDLLQDGSRYFDVHHTANDVVDRIDPPTLARAAAAFATAAWAAAEMDGDFGRLPDADRAEHW